MGRIFEQFWRKDLARTTGKHVGIGLALVKSYPIDGDLLAALSHGMPDCAGVALGLDRLLMVLLDIDSIDRVMTFCE